MSVSELPPRTEPALAAPSLEARIARFLFQPVDISVLVFFRIVFASTMLWHVWRYYSGGDFGGRRSGAGVVIVPHLWESLQTLQGGRGLAGGMYGEQDLRTAAKTPRAATLSSAKSLRRADWTKVCSP